MRIAYFTDTFLPQVNGVATALANQAAELGMRGHNVLIFTPKLDHIRRKKFEAKNVTVIHVPTVPAPLYPEFKLGVFGLPKVVKFLIKFKPDIIHLHTPLTAGMDAMMAAKLFNKPLVGTVHVYLAESGYLRWLKYKLAVKIVDKVAQKFLNFIFKQCDLVLVPSKMLISELKEDSFEKPVGYLPNGVSLQKAQPLSEKESRAFKKRYGLKEKVILHFGRLSHEKNVDILIKAFAILSKRHEDISLLIIGDGPTRKKLTKLVKKLGLSKKIVFTGFIDHQILLSSGLLRVADVFATASPMENNPMVVLESMMIGLPVVGVKQAGLIELVSGNGFLVEPLDTKMMAEKIEKILFDEKLKEQMSRQSLKMVKPYAINNVADKLLAFYKSLKQ